jgi:hypothetical protein
VEAQEAQEEEAETLAVPSVASVAVVRRLALEVYKARVKPKSARPFSPLGREILASIFETDLFNWYFTGRI